MSESKTPKTDEEAALPYSPHGMSKPSSLVDADFARQLESDLAAALAERDSYKTAWEQSDKSCRDLSEKVLPNVRAERDALAAQVEKAEASRWQPIETCPESCRGEYPKYVLFYNGYHIGVGFCYPSEDGDGGTLYLDEIDQIVTPRPTHWMPPPLPPGNAAALAERDALAARVAEHDEYARLLDIRSYDTEAETAMDECINSPDWLAKLSKHPALIVRRLAARVAELENDAGRWRFVRSKVSRILNERTLKMDGLRVEVYYDEPQPFVILPTDNGALFDEAIDAALSREEKS